MRSSLLTAEQEGKKLQKKIDAQKAQIARERKSHMWVPERGGGDGGVLELLAKAGGSCWVQGSGGGWLMVAAPLGAAGHLQPLLCACACC